MHTEPLITIAIPTYKRVDYLRQALKSAVMQTYFNLEILVSDNANEPEAEFAVREMCDPRIRYIPQPINLGMAGNWDALVQQARGDYFIILSDDDLLMSNTISGLFKGLDNNPQSAFSFCSVCFINSEGYIKGIKLVKGGLYSGLNNVLEFLRGGNSPFLCGTLYDRKKFMETTYFCNTSCRMASDAAAWMRVSLCYDAAFAVEEVYCGYRVHTDSQSNGAGIEGWKNDLDQLKLEIIYALNQYGFEINESGVLKREFDQHCAQFMRNLIIGTQHKNFVDMINAWSLIIHYRFLLIYNLGMISFLFMFLYILLPTFISDFLKHVKKSITSKFIPSLGLLNTKILSDFH